MTSFVQKILVDSDRHEFAMFDLIVLLLTNHIIAMAYIPYWSL